MADYIGATPQVNPLMGLLAERLKQAQEFAFKPFGYSNPPAEAILNLLGIPAVQQTAERIAYGEPLTTGSGMTTQIRPEAIDAALTVAPAAGLLGRGVERGAMAAGRAGERYAEKVVPQIMERGGLPAQLLGDLSQGSIRQVIEKNPAPFIVKHGTNQPFDEFKSGMGVTAKHIYTTPEEYAQDAAKYGDTLITAQASPKSLIDFSSEGKLDKQTISALKKAAKDAGITDKYYPFESFIDDVMSGQLYQKGGGSRDQDALLSELFSKYQAVKMPDATSGGGISKSVVFEDPSVLKVLKDEGLLGQSKAAESAAVLPGVSIQGGEKPLRSAVVLVGDKVFFGNTHTDAISQAIKEGVIKKEAGKFIYPEGAEVDMDLFLTNEGQIIDRLQAYKMMDVGASESANQAGIMQQHAPSSMTVDEYMKQANAIRQKKEKQGLLD